ncbi:ROK family transcriptional regulator [Lacrimispora sp.]|uniref:ROK family transcriptional regulator n=1 Tax=Lacrimispora sp. TaxID=2719234 RepID=UPI002FDA9226
MVVGSKELIRDINTNLILESIINVSSISRVTLAKNLGLTKATVSAIVQDLINKKLVIEIGSDDTTKGRKPILLSFNQREGYVISIDLGVDHISLLLSDLKGENRKLKQYKNSVPSFRIIDLLKNIIDDTLAELSTTVYGVIGISLSIHGVVYKNSIVFTPYYSLEQIDLKKELEDIFHIPVYVENEANLSVIGEKTFCYDYPNIINISVHSGIGIGIISQNKLYTGYNGYAGEFGHTIIVPDGRPCPCGNKGCFEQYASEKALMQEFSKLKNLPQMDFDSFVSYYKKGDPDAQIILNEFIRYMSIGVNNILNTFNPDVIVINSSFVTYFPDTIDRIESSITNRMNKYCTLLPSKLQDIATLLGGTCTCIKNFLGIKYLQLNTKPSQSA